METQYCTKCKQDLPLEAYSPSKRGKRGKPCRACQRIDALAWYHRNNDKAKQQKKARYDADPERHRQYSYDWRKRNPEYQKEWRTANIERARAYGRKWYHTHPEAVRAYREARKEARRAYRAAHYRRNLAHSRIWGEQYYEANKERIRERRQLRRRLFPTQHRKYDMLRRARKRAATIGVVDFDRILARDGWVCHLCGGLVAAGELSFDHIVPLAKGGAHTEGNLAVAHLRCNLRKGARTDVTSVAPPRIRKSQQR